MANYSPIRISTIKPILATTFEVHMLYKETYIRYAETGAQFDMDKLKKLKKQKMAKFFILEEDEEKYQTYLDSLLEAAMDDPDVTSDEKAELVQGQSLKALDDIRSGPPTAASYEATKKAASNIVKMIQKDPAVLKSLFKTDNEEDVTLQTAINASGLAVRMAQGRGWDEDKILSITLGCMLRDIGITQMDEKYHRLYKTPLSEFTDIELKVYKTHPKLSAQILQDKDFASEDVLRIIITHEERISGQGFPNGLNKLEEHEEIVALCSCYDRMVTCLDMAPSDAIKSLTIDELGNFKLDNINALKKLLKADGLL